MILSPVRSLFTDLPRIDSKGNARRYPRAGENGIYEFVDPTIPGEVFPRKHVGGGGEPLLDDKGDILTKRMGNLTTIHGARRTGCYHIQHFITFFDDHSGADGERQHCVAFRTD